MSKFKSYLWRVPPFILEQLNEQSGGEFERSPATQVLTKMICEKFGIERPPTNMAHRRLQLGFTGHAYKYDVLELAVGESKVIPWRRMPDNSIDESGQTRILESVSRQSRRTGRRFDRIAVPDGIQITRIM